MSLDNPVTPVQHKDPQDLDLVFDEPDGENGDLKAQNRVYDYNTMAGGDKDGLPTIFEKSQ